MACRHAKRAIILSISVRPDVSILKCLSCESEADSSGWVGLVCLRKMLALNPASSVQQLESELMCLSS